MNKKIVLILLTGIILLAGILRFWQLGKVPISPDWDEVALGYNAYSILHTGRDEYGAFLPIVLQSYGDYKPALYAYITIPSVAIFGLNVMAVRLPSALFGVLTILFTFLLVKELCKRNDIALLSSFLLAISPWHIQFSRVAFETNVGLALNILGALLFLKALRKPWLFIVSAGVFALTPYVYQSEKVFTPLLVLFLILLFGKKLLALPKKYLILAAIVGMVVVAPMGIYTIFGKGGLSRAAGVSIFSSTAPYYKANNTRYAFNKSHHDIIGLVLDNERFVYAKAAIGNYLSHFDVNWLFIVGDIGRHHAPNMALLYLWELPFVGIGIFQLLFGKFDIRTKLFIFGWWLLAPIPAAITIDVPHAVRTLNFLPMYQIFTAIGLLYTFHLFTNKQFHKIPYGKILLVGVAAVALFNFVYYLDQYFVQQNYFNRSDWQYGYEQIVAMAQDMGKSYNEIVVSNRGQFDESYMFFLFYEKANPAIYQKEAQQLTFGIRHFGKYTFRTINWAQDSKLHNVLFIGDKGSFSDPVEGQKKFIYNTDGTILAQFVGRP